jgi:hypothetical protein
VRDPPIPNKKLHKQKLKLPMLETNEDATWRVMSVSSSLI